MQSMSVTQPAQFDVVPFLALLLEGSPCSSVHCDSTLMLQGRPGTRVLHRYKNSPLLLNVRSMKRDRGQAGKLNTLVHLECGISKKIQAALKFPVSEVC